jgi:hypothetical protein
LRSASQAQLLVTEPLSEFDRGVDMVLFDLAPVRLLPMRSGVQAHQDAPSLFMPAGNKTVNVAQLLTSPYNQLVVIFANRCSGIGANRDYLHLIRVAVGLNKGFDQLNVRPSDFGGNGGIFLVFFDWFGQ